MSRKYQIFLLFLFFSNILVAQHPVYYQINDEDNLPSNEVYRVVQDDFGFIWIGCDAGLYRYDGFNFKHYTNAQQNGRGISFLKIDNKQRVWCKNFFGQIYRAEGDSLKIVWERKTSNPSEPQFTIDDQCNLWTYYKNTITQYNDVGDSLQTFVINDRQSKQNIISLHYYKGAIYVVFNNIEIYRFDLKKKLAEQIVHKNSIPINSLNSMFVSHNNELLLLVETGIANRKYIIYKLVNNQLFEYFDFEGMDPDLRVYAIYSDGDNLWYTSSKGAAMIDQRSPQAYMFSSTYFKDKKVSYMLKDREGVYWFSTLQDGLLLVQSTSVVSINNINSGLTDKNISTIYTTKNGKILLGLYTGDVFEYDPMSLQLTEKYTSIDQRFIAVKAILQNERYTIISRGHLCIIDNATQRQYYPKVSNIRDLELVGDTLYMIMTDFIAKQSISTLISSNLGEVIQVKSSGGRAIEYDPQNQIFYFAMGDGTFVLSPNGIWSELTNNGNKIYTNSMQFANGILWLATVADGVYGFENNQIKYHYHSANLLTENDTRHIKVTKESIWLSTENYLYHIFYKNNSVAKYHQYNAINSKEINAITHSGNFVYLATNKGLVFFPDNIPWKNLTRPNLQIEGVYVNGTSIPFSAPIRLSYSNRNVKVDFVSTAFKSRGSFKYQYRLQGVDTTWVDIPANNSFINFTKLPVGSYQLQLRSGNENNIYSQPVVLDIYVESPFWQKWWFYVLSVLFIIACMAIAFNIRIKYIKKRAELKNKLTASQLTALKSQMNPHFLFNTLNSLQDLILKHDIKNSNYYLGKYSTLMRMVLNVSGKDEISIVDEIEMLDTYLQLEKLRFGDDFIYTIQVDPSIDTEHTYIPPMIIQPFVENAIKHGLLHKKGEKELKLRLMLDKQIICTVEDNGVGRKKAGEINSRQKGKHQSFATDATEKRIELLNSITNKKFKFSIEDLMEEGGPKGTRVTIELGN